MRDTSKVDRTVVVDEFQELSKREMEDVTGGGEGAKYGYMRYEPTGQGFGDDPDDLCVVIMADVIRDVTALMAR